MITIKSDAKMALKRVSTFVRRIWLIGRDVEVTATLARPRRRRSATASDVRPDSGPGPGSTSTLAGIGHAPPGSSGRVASIRPKLDIPRLEVVKREPVENRDL